MRRRSSHASLHAAGFPVFLLLPQMLKATLLALAPRGALNMHGSLLPKYRGRVPINWAIIHGETETGATLHYMTEKPDSGDIVAQAAVPILPDDTAKDVFEKVTLAAGDLPRSRFAGAHRGHGAAHAAGPEPGQLFRRTQAGGWHHRLVEGRSSRSTIWCAQLRRPTRAHAPRSWAAGADPAHARAGRDQRSTCACAHRRERCHRRALRRRRIAGRAGTGSRWCSGRR